MDLPIRVLHRGMSYNKGGIETYLMNYYRNMDKSKVQFDFIVPQGMSVAYEDEIKEMGGRIYKEIISLKKHPIKGLFYDRRFFIRHPEISIVHVNDCSAANLRLLKTAKRCGVQTSILHSHNNDYLVPLCRRQLLVEKYNKSHLKEIATDLFACSEAAGRFMFGNLDYHIVKNAIKPEQYVFSQKIRQEIRQDLGIAEDKTVLGCVARFDYQKNHTFLLDLFEEYKRINPMTVLVLVGDGPLRPVIEKTIKDKQIQDSVILLGVRDDVPALLNAFDLFVLPSKSEGLGIVLIEAQVNGLRCIASDNVSVESNILDNVLYLPLECGASVWAEQILRITSVRDYDRNVDLSMVRKAGYDIEWESKKLEAFYLKRARESLR